MSITNFDAFNIDLSNIFFPRISTDPSLGYDTNYTVNGVDLTTLFYPYTRGNYANSTGYEYNSSDLNTLFQNINVNPSWTALISGGTNGLNGYCNALAIDSVGNVYVGGVFTQAGSTSANSIAKWDGSSWSALGNGLTKSGGTASCRALAIDSNNNLYAGGSFTTAGTEGVNYIAKWDGTTWSALGTGNNYGLNNYCDALAIDPSNNVYAGGSFTTAGGTSITASYIAKWDGTSWSALISGGTNGLNNYCLALAINKGSRSLYIGGQFTSPGNYVAQWDLDLHIWFGPSIGLNKYCYALAIASNYDVYIGGEFTSPSSYIIKWDGGNWYALSNGLNSSCISLAIDSNNNVYAGGLFTSPGAYVAKWNRFVWSSLSSGLNSQCDALAIDSNNYVYAGGSFTQAGGITADYIAKY